MQRRGLACSHRAADRVTRDLALVAIIQLCWSSKSALYGSTPFGVSQVAGCGRCVEQGVTEAMPNTSSELRVAARKHADTALRTLVGIMTSTKASPHARIA